MGLPGLMPVAVHDLSRVYRGDHDAPHAILGPHPWNEGVTLRVLDRRATGIVARGPWGETRLEREFLDVWSGTLPGPRVPRYHLVAEYRDEHVVREDPYRFGPTLSDVDLHLISEGRHELAWTRLGAHVRDLEGVLGTAFSV